MEDFLDDRELDVDLEQDAVRVPEDLVAVLLEDRLERGEVGPFRDGRDDVAVVVEHREPGAEPVGRADDVVGSHFVALQLLDDVRAHAALVEHADKRRLQLKVGDVFGDVAAHAAVHLDHPAGVPAGGDVLRERIAFDIDHDGADDDDAHKRSSLLPGDECRLGCAEFICGCAELF